MTQKTVFIAALLALSMPAWAGGHPEPGQRIVESRCVSCHEAPAGTTVSDAYPTLIAIAKRHRQNQRWVHAWLTGPHPPMRGIDLSQQEIADVIAYLETLPTE
jgi:cytochrome c553